MTLADCLRHTGKRVMWRQPRTPWCAATEHGVITDIDNGTVWVRFDEDRTPVAVRPQDLTLEPAT